MSNSQSPLIRHVNVSELFGQFTYKLDFGGGLSSDGNISILYGANASGKTTLLRMIYGALSRVAQKGSKSYLAETPFRRLQVVLTNGSEVLVEKTDLVGDVDFTLRFANGGVHNYNFVATDDNVIKRGDNPQIKELLLDLAELEIDLFHITDKREYFTTIEHLRPHRSSQDRLSEEETAFAHYLLRYETERDNKAFRVEDIAPVIRDIFKTKLLERGNVGQQSTNSIYLELARAVVGKNETQPVVTSRAELLATVHRLQSAIDPAVRLEAIPQVPFDSFIETIKQATDENISALSQVLSPFLTSLDARIDAIKPDVNRISSFLEEINRFYRGKKFHFSVGHGFYIKGIGGAPSDIPMDWLSSGERQLFTILASVFLTQQSSGIVLIDEPELSLNTLWQRDFVRALQRIGADASVQYVLATHSLEILAKQERRVITLNAEIDGGGSATAS